MPYFIVQDFNEKDEDRPHVEDSCDGADRNVHQAVEHNNKGKVVDKAAGNHQEEI